MENYKNRIIEKQIKNYLKVFGAINIVGPKWCGKSWTSLFFAKSNISFGDFLDKNALQISFNDDPSFVLNGEKPRLIDEWQELPSTWDAIRRYCDKVSSKGNFILTGSTSQKVKTAHSGIGRIAKIKMYPLSLYESGESNGQVSLNGLFNNKFTPCSSNLKLKDLIYISCRGGWPVSVFHDLSNENRLLIAQEYVKELYESDIMNVGGIKRDSTLMKSILKSYARNISTLAKNKTIYEDAGTNFLTLESYINVLKDLYIIEELEPWNTNIRSSSIRVGPKREFVDPSIACAALNATPDKLMNDLNTFGFIFETLCIRDLRVYSSSLGGELCYYHDKLGLECDCVLTLSDGRYALIEIKLGSTKKIQEGIDNLNKLEEIIKKYNDGLKETKSSISKKIPMPSFKMILTNSPWAVKKDNNLYIVPIGCLKD